MQDEKLNNVLVVGDSSSGAAQAVTQVLAKASVKVVTVDEAQESVSAHRQAAQAVKAIETADIKRAKGPTLVERLKQNATKVKNVLSPFTQFSKSVSRLSGETFTAYKARRKANNKRLKQYLLGRMVWRSVVLVEDPGTHVTYSLIDRGTYGGRATRVSK